MLIWIPCQMCGWQLLPLICRLSLNCNDFLCCEEAFNSICPAGHFLSLSPGLLDSFFWKSLPMPTSWRCLRPSWGCFGLPSLPEEGALYVLAVPAPLHSPLKPTDAWRAELPLFAGFMSLCVESRAPLSDPLCLLLITTPGTSTHWALTDSLGMAPQRMPLNFLLLQEGQVCESAQGLKAPQLQIGWWTKGHRGPEKGTNSLSYVNVQVSLVPFFSHLSPARVLRILWFVGIF